MYLCDCALLIASVMRGASQAQTLYPSYSRCTCWIALDRTPDTGERLNYYVKSLSKEDGRYFHLVSSSFEEINTQIGMFCFGRCKKDVSFLIGSVTRTIYIRSPLDFWTNVCCARSLVLHFWTNVCCTWSLILHFWTNVHYARSLVQITPVNSNFLSFCGMTLKRY